MQSPDLVWLPLDYVYLLGEYLRSSYEDGSSKGSCNSWNLVVTGVGVRMKESFESFQEFLRVFATSSRLVLKDSYGVFAVLSSAVYPYVRIVGVFAPLLIHNLDRSFICVYIFLLQELFMHQIYQWHQPITRCSYYPVGHGGTA